MPFYREPREGLLHGCLFFSEFSELRLRRHPFACPFFGQAKDIAESPTAQKNLNPLKG
jgi:hypothetical protein